MSENKFNEENKISETQEIPSAENINSSSNKPEMEDISSNSKPDMEDINSNSKPEQEEFSSSENSEIQNNEQTADNDTNTDTNSSFDKYDGYYDNSAESEKTEKKSSYGRKVALIAGAIAITLCLGVGGGFLGAYLANHPQTSTVSSTTKTISNNDNSGKKNDNEPVLQIVQASNTEITPTTTQEVAELVKDSVVEITTETTTYDTFYGQYVSQGAGSGVIISTDGYIITNNHVIEDAQTITVRLTNEKSYPARLIGTDETLDVALLKIEAEDLTAATFGTSANLKVGQTAIAIGNPLGQLGGTVTDGIISALDREIEVDGTTMTLLQTNAAINPGNSGGGLFDANGNLIGLVVAKSSRTSSGTSLEGLGFAIPVDNIINILSDLKTSGYVTGRAYLGVTVIDVSDEQTAFMYRLDRTGVYVASVEAGGAAEAAGIKIYDCITKIGDTEISSKSQLSAALSKLKANDTVKVTVVRDGKEITLDVTLGESVPQTVKQSSSGNNSQSGFGSRGYGGYFGNYYNYGNNSENDI